jgi:hypothetical protein
VRLAILALALATAGIVQSRNTGFNIAGQVVHEGGNPVRGARVSIFLSHSAEQQVSCVTGENGGFAFLGVAAGKYSLQVSYHGVTQLYKQYEEFSTAIVVGPGLDSEHIVFSLEQPGAIAGSVLDDTGDPVRNASVYLFARSIYRGVARTGLKETKATGSDGSFHFSHLQPGVYYVGVAGRPWYAQNAVPPRPVSVPLPADQVQPAAQEQPPSRSELDVAYPFTYYSNATSPDGATPITVEAGGRVEIEFNLHPVAALHIALDSVENTADQHPGASLQIVGPGGTLVNAPTTTTGRPLSLVGVAPGEYVINGSVWANNKMIQLGAQTVNLSTDTTVHLNDSVKTSVRGELILAGDIPGSVAVLLEGIGNSNEPSALIEPDGVFTMPDVPPGRYNLRLANTSELYIKSVAIKGGRYANGVVELNRGAQIELNITAARGLTKIEGIAVRDGKPVAGAMVLAIPQDYSHGKYIPRDQTDSDGSFSLLYAPPGRYTLVAIEDGQDLEYANPNVIAPYLTAGVAVEAPTAANAKLHVEVQTRK